MPRKKRSGNRRGAPSTSRAEPSGSTTENRDSTFSNFTVGLAQAAATSSPPPNNKLDRLAELKAATVAQLEDEHAATVGHINATFEKLEKALGNAGNMIYDAATFGGILSLTEAVEKAIEANIQTGAVSRTNLENMPPPTIRRWRRSRSAGPPGCHTTILSHRLRKSTSSHHLGLRTPAANIDLGIATVTPHPNYTKSGSSRTLTVLRQPIPGEMVISMGGSPLSVNLEHGSSPSVTVPLSDGRVFKVLGKHSPFKEEMKRGIDAETKEKLKQLRDFIGELV